MIVLVRSPIIATAIAIPLLAGVLVAESRQDSTLSAGWRCAAPPTEPCFTHRGRLSTQNGIGQMIWLVGTKRIMAVALPEIPAMLEKYLYMTSPDHSDVYGDFEICPLEPDRPGHMRSACIVGATRLVVQDRARSRPPIRLLSTWPPAERQSPIGLDPRVPPADPAKYRDILAASDWKNPSVTILPDAIMVSSFVLEHGQRIIPVSELRQLLVSLPVSAWPYGRVVLASDAGIRRADGGDEEKIRTNHDQVNEILRRLRIEVDWWPS